MSANIRQYKDSKNIFADNTMKGIAQKLKEKHQFI